MSPLPPLFFFFISLSPPPPFGSTETDGSARGLFFLIWSFSRSRVKTATLPFLSFSPPPPVVQTVWSNSLPLQYRKEGLFFPFSSCFFLSTATKRIPGSFPAGAELLTDFPPSPLSLPPLSGLTISSNSRETAQPPPLFFFFSFFLKGPGKSMETASPSSLFFFPLPFPFSLYSSNHKKRSSLILFFFPLKLIKGWTRKIGRVSLPLFFFSPLRGRSE